MITSQTVHIHFFWFKNEVLLYSNRLTLNSFYNFTARTIRTFLIDFDISNSLMSKYKFNSNKLKSNKLDDFLRLVSDSRTSSYVLIFLNWCAYHCSLSRHIELNWMELNSACVNHCVLIHTVLWCNSKRLVVNTTYFLLSELIELAIFNCWDFKIKIKQFTFK